MAYYEDITLVPCNFKIPLSMHKEFHRKFPRRGERSKIIRALIQMVLNGDIKDIKYVTKVKS